MNLEFNLVEGVKNVILGNKVVNKLKFSTNVNNERCTPKIVFFNENFFQKDSNNFLHKKLTLKVRILQFLTTFTLLPQLLPS